MNPFIYYTMCRRAKILFYCKLPRIGIYSIQLTPQIMSKPFRIWFTHVRNNLFTGIGKTLHCMPDSAYRHSVELHQMVRNGYSVSIRWVVKTVQCSLPMWRNRWGQWKWQRCDQNEQELEDVKSWTSCFLSLCRIYVCHACKWDGIRGPHYRGLTLGMLSFHLNILYLCSRLRCTPFPSFLLPLRSCMPLTRKRFLLGFTGIDILWAIPVVCWECSQ